MTDLKENTMNTSLSKRLLAAASFVRAGAVVADVGTDHAYLPIYLVERGIAARAVASDINKGPYERAQANVAQHSLSHKIDTLCVGGLEGIDSFSPTDVLICGMGGELISNILGAAPFVKDPAVRLILQPMTHPELLRKYLNENGFSIIDETVVLDDRLYQIICAEFSGKTEKYSDVELLLGKINIKKRADELILLCEREISLLCEIRRAKLLGGADASGEDERIRLLEEIKNDGK